jgi:hypothetical protein
MLASLAQFVDEPTVADTGLPQQAALRDRLLQRGQSPPVVDAADVLASPERMLRLLCVALNVPFYEQMLSWDSGPRPTDGAWGPFWYADVYKTTGFKAPGATQRELPRRLEPTLVECELIYSELWARRLI